MELGPGKASLSKQQHLSTVLIPDNCVHPQQNPLHLANLMHNCKSLLPAHPFNQGGACIAAGKLLAKEPELKANFSRAQGAGSNAKANKVARFLPNPEANWGPKPKHGRAVKVCYLCLLCTPNSTVCMHYKDQPTTWLFCLPLTDLRPLGLSIQLFCGAEEMPEVRTTFVFW